MLLSEIFGLGWGGRARSLLFRGSMRLVFLLVSLLPIVVRDR